MYRFDIVEELVFSVIFAEFLIEAVLSQIFVENICSFGDFQVFCKGTIFSIAETILLLEF